MNATIKRWATLLLLAAGDAQAQTNPQILRGFGHPGQSEFAPAGDLARSADGYFYGATSRGGLHDGGAVFRISHEGSNYTVLRHFGGTTNDGRMPTGTLIESADGFLYGTTDAGGAFGKGTVFKVRRDGDGYAIIKHIEGPYLGTTPVIEGTNGMLYGIQGLSLYRVARDGTGFQAIHQFGGYLPTGVLDGSGVAAPLRRGSDGFLYGTMFGGGSHDYGVLFKISHNGSNYELLLSFQGQAGLQGREPRAQLLEGTDGYLYCTTVFGGGFDQGLLFQISKTGGDWPLVEFNGASRGLNPYGGVVEGPGRLLYGTTRAGGQNGFGTVYRYGATDGRFAVIKHLAGGDEGGYPMSGLTFGTNGLLYGLTTSRYTESGTLVRLSTNGAVFDVLKRFNRTGGDGSGPLVGLTATRPGEFHGVTARGGADDFGVLFKVNADGGGYQIIKEFRGAGADGRSPQGRLLYASDGRIFGTTVTGGSNNLGTLFRINPDGSDYRVLKHFRSDQDGRYPQAELLEGSNGAIYGVAYEGGSNFVGTVFRVAKDGAGFQVLKHFGRRNVAELDIGSRPLGGLVETLDGWLYGTASAGGTNGGGSLFRLRLDGTAFEVIRFYAPNSLEGSRPAGRLVRAEDGWLYGTTAYGGQENSGTSFRLRPDGTGYEVIASVARTDGYPIGGLTETPGGFLYGACYSATGTNGGALVQFRTEGSGYQVVSRLPGGAKEYRLPGEGMALGPDGALTGVVRAGGLREDGGIFRIQAALREGWRRTGQLTALDESSGGLIFDRHPLERSPVSRAVEYGLFARGPGGLDLELVLRRADGSGAGVAAEARPVALLTFPSSEASGLEAVIRSRQGAVGAYELALYPIVRPGVAVNGTLKPGLDPWTTNRTAAVGTGRWRADDYLLRGVQTGDRLTVRVDSADFAPFIEVRLLMDESVAQYAEGSTLPMIVQGTAEGARDYLIRVTSAASGAEGAYALRVETAGSEPVIWSFTPGAGIPGTWVTIRGTNFQDGLNPLVTGVQFGGAPGSLTEPTDTGDGQEFMAQVPSGAVTGRITVLTAGAGGSSTNDFIVLAPVGAVRSESGGRFSFGISNAVAGLRNVVESAPSFSDPVVWTPVATNAVTAPGAWRYTNAPGESGSQRYFRVKTE